jgi:hypothetical protein
VTKLTVANKCIDTEAKRIKVAAKSVASSSAIEGVKVSQKSLREHLSKPTTPSSEKAG